MNLQAQLNNQAIRMLPRVHLLILGAYERGEEFEGNQMKCKALQRMGNSLTAIKELYEYDEETFEAFENDLINQFKLNGWIK